MDLGLMALVVIATFSTVHERVIELLRRTFRGPPEYTDSMAIHDGFGRGLLRRLPRASELAQPAAGAIDPASPSPGLIRRFAPAHRWKKARKLLDGLTIGPWSVLLGIGFAFGSRADALALFRHAPGSSDMAFFTVYLGGWHDLDLRPWLWDREARRSVLGCVLMGLSTALGSRFWHDLSKGLIDLRAKARETQGDAKKLLAPPDAPPAQTVSAMAKSTS